MHYVEPCCPDSLVGSQLPEFKHGSAIRRTEVVNIWSSLAEMRPGIRRRWWLTNAYCFFGHDCRSIDKNFLPFDR